MVTFASFVPTNKMRKILLSVIDFFYPPFKRFVSLHNFRYLATGGGTFLAGNAVYYLSFHFLFTADVVNLLYIPLKRETAALVVDFAVIIPLSFLLNKYVIFTHSKLKGRTQFFRFFNLQWINILMNYVLLKLFVEIFHIYPTFAIFSVKILIAIFSYVYQHYFTFSVKKFGKKK